MLAYTTYILTAPIHLAIPTAINPIGPHPAKECDKLHNYANLHTLHTQHESRHLLHACICYIN